MEKIETLKTKTLIKKKDIRLDKFIEYALYKKNGYYSNYNPIGEKRDFITSPEISQMFGEIIGVFLLYIWDTKIKNRFNLIELGPGKGTLFKDIYNSVKKNEYFLNNAKINFIEINDELIKIQKNNISDLNIKNFSWRKSINFKSRLPKIIYSNEFFDCFPVRHFIYKDFTKPIGYSMSKSAVVLMSKYLSTYYSEKFNINTVIFGGVYDERFDKSFVNNYNKNVPMNRMMNVDEVTSVFDFLLDEKSSYVNGTELIIDGGWTAK